MVESKDPISSSQDPKRFELQKLVCDFDAWQLLMSGWVKILSGAKSTNVALLSASLRCERLRMEARKGLGGCGQDTGHGQSHLGLS